MSTNFLRTRGDNARSYWCGFAENARLFTITHGTDDFLKEVMDRLRAGFHNYEGVDLTGWFNDFLSWIMDGGHLSAFLAYIDHERGGDGCETEQAGTSHETSPVPIAADKNKWSFTLERRPNVGCHI
jgi:hypothetical protein